MPIFNIPIDVPAAKKNEVLDAVVRINGWTDMVKGPDDAQGNPTVIPNPETQEQALKRLVIHFLRTHYTAYISENAGRTAHDNARKQAEAVEFT